MPAPSAGYKSKVSLKTAASAASSERSGFVQLRESELTHDAPYLPGGGGLQRHRGGAMSPRMEESGRVRRDYVEV